jgi:hypothetical protein
VSLASSSLQVVVGAIAGVEETLVAGVASKDDTACAGGLRDRRGRLCGGEFGLGFLLCLGSPILIARVDELVDQVTPPPRYCGKCRG